MTSPDRRPSAEDLDRLIEHVRRDPGSRAFIALGEAYLALGRAREAIEIGVAGLRAPRPDAEHDGRVMVARALVALHQWKEAQAELLKVVKVDRNNRAGFALLGEVLLRRGDYERALPVLQHAQNLEPSNPNVLSMLRKARAGQPLDPLPAIPTPIEPARSSGSGERAQSSKKPSMPPAPPPRMPAPDIDDGPTKVAEPPQEMIASAPPPKVDITRSPDGSRKPVAATAQPAPGVPPAVRPRVIGGAKPANPAADALRASAAAGENYLNDLLTGGLLDVPGVRVPDSEFDIRPDRRWGRSAGRLFVALFVLLVLGAGGGVAWYYVHEQQKAEGLKQHRAAAAELVTSGSFEDLDAAAREMAIALELDRRSAVNFAGVAQITGLQSLLYGYPPVNTNDAIRAAQRDVKDAKQAGWRELLIGRAAVTLATLSTESDADATLAAIRGELDAWVGEHPDDRWARWLQARAMLAAGERAAGKAGLESAADGADGLLAAKIDLADLKVDDGKLDDALKLYDEVLDREPGHPLALVGKVLAWAERGVEKDRTLGLLNVELTDKKFFGKRVRSYRNLALGLAKSQIESYEDSEAAFKTALVEAPEEPRYLARVAQARLLAGDFATAARARAQVAWFGKGKPEPDPLVTLFDAALLVESGLPARGLDVLGAVEGTRAHLIRAQALIDLGRAADARAEAEAAVETAPDNAEAQALLVWAKVLTATGSERDQLVKSDLNKVANAMTSKRGRHVEGAALFAIGSPDARQKLDLAVDKISAAEPNPIAYRTYTLLARLDLAEGKLEDAQKHVQAALAANGGYLPAMVVGARVLLAGGDAEGALEALAPVLKETDAVTWEVELAHAEALAAREGATDADRALAAEQVKKAKQHGAPATEVGRVASLINADLPDQLGVPGAEGAEKPDKKKPGKKKRRR